MFGGRDTRSKCSTIPSAISRQALPDERQLVQRIMAAVGLADARPIAAHNRAGRPASAPPRGPARAPPASALFPLRRNRARRWRSMRRSVATAPASTKSRPPRARVHAAGSVRRIRAGCAAGPPGQPIFAAPSGAPRSRARHIRWRAPARRRRAGCPACRAGWPAATQPGMVTLSQPRSEDRALMLALEIAGTPRRRGGARRSGHAGGRHPRPGRNNRAQAIAGWLDQRHVAALATAASAALPLAPGCAALPAPPAEVGRGDHVARENRNPGAGVGVVQSNFITSR